MELYARAPALRTRQVVADLGMLLWVWVFGSLGRLVHDLVSGLAAPGRAVERAGRSLSGGAIRGGDVAGLPILWLGLRWASWRGRWAAEAAAARRLLEEPGGTALLAHRALGRRSLRRLRSAEPDPWGAFAAGRYDRLAAAELEVLGLSSRPRERPRRAGGPARGRQG